MYFYKIHNYSISSSRFKTPQLLYSPTVPLPEPILMRVSRATPADSSNLATGISKLTEASKVKNKNQTP